MLITAVTKTKQSEKFVQVEFLDFLDVFLQFIQVKRVSSKDKIALLGWFQKNARPLPWRKNKDPYFIWISEMMLQQTTATATIPYFSRFIKRFPNLKSLAKAPLDEVLEAWSGLGYYSRARYLHSSAKELYKQDGFPQTYKELIKLPGIGPYTARAISSIAFDESVGVLDGNVHRVLSRKYNVHEKIWTSQGRERFQSLADEFVKDVSSGKVNQALMELGALICRPENPRCFLCPLSKTCEARREDVISHLPLKKSPKKWNLWKWTPYVIRKKSSIALIENNYLPFLKGHLVFPGKIQKIKKKPKKYDYIHSITSNKIYVALGRDVKIKGNYLWIPLKSVKKKSPSSLILKGIEKTL